MQNAATNLELQKLAESLNKKLLLLTRTLAFLGHLESKVQARLETVPAIKKNFQVIGSMRQRWLTNMREKRA